MNYLLFIFGLTIITDITKAQNSTTCITPNNEHGLCLELNRCNYLYNGIESQRSKQQSSFLRFSICGYSNGNVMYCCALGSIIPMPIIPATSRVQIIDSNTQPWSCGGGVIEPLSYMINITKLNEFPWMTLLGFTQTSSNLKVYFCEGSLINNRYVIISAHCIKRRSSEWSLTEVRLGEWDMTKDRDCIRYSEEKRECTDSHIDVPVQRIIVHENFNLHSKINDIGLLRLANQVQFTEWISPICLPLTNSLRTATFDRVAFDIAGWGREDVNFRKIKSKTMAIVTPLSICNLTYSEIGIYLRDDQICAGGVQGVDLCLDYIGYSLIGLDTTNKLRNKYFLAGIYSFGITPCKIGHPYPHVYTRVGLYVNWILENIQP